MNLCNSPASRQESSFFYSLQRTYTLSRKIVQNRDVRLYARICNKEIVS